MKEGLEIVSEEIAENRMYNKWRMEEPSSHSEHGYWVEVTVWENSPDNTNWTIEQIRAYKKKVIDHFQYYHHNK